jgi:hypothetical protein
VARGFGVALALVLMFSGCGGSAVRERGTGDAGSSAGASSTGGSGAGGAAGCASELCTSPACPDGELIVSPGECCPVCSCEGVECEPGIPALCPDGTGLTPAGACCPVCAASVEASCAGVECREVGKCEEGHHFLKYLGACCSDCSRSGDFACDGISCPAMACPSGYVRAQPPFGCCDECIPDRLYCVLDEDCLMADFPDACCECPEPLSRRRFRTDACWIDLASMSPIPEYCYPEFVCDGRCDADCINACGLELCSNRCEDCPVPGVARCLNHRCTEVR